jgi:hypothetical protein
MVEPQPGWPEYLDGLEDYLRTVSGSLEQRDAFALPAPQLRKPAAALPAAHAESAAVLLSEIERVTEQVRVWIEEVLCSMRSIEARRRIEPCRAGAIVNSVF